MKEINKPIYADDRRIDLTAYLGPRRAGKNIYDGVYGAYPLDPKEGYPSFITDEVFQLYKKAGLNFLMPEGDAYYGYRLTETGFVDEPDFEKSDLYHYMKVAERNGLGVYPTSEELFSQMSHSEGIIEQKDKESLKRMIQTIQSHFPDIFWGIMVTDEPTHAQMGRVKSIMDYLWSDEIQEIKPDLKVFASMLPMYGTLASYGAENEEHSADSPEGINARKSIYGKYIDACIDAMQEFSVDFYPLVDETLISSWFYTNLEMAAERCKRAGCPLAVTLQSCRLDAGYDEKTGHSKVVYRTPHYEDMRWQVYSALAFGASRLGYYTFWPHYIVGPDIVHQNAMVVFEPSDEKGYRTTEIYDAVKKVHQEILAFDHVFLRFQWQGCHVVRTSEDLNIHYVKGGYKDDALVSVKATRDLLIGCMKNLEDGRKGYWIVNAENPYRVQMNDVEIIWKEAANITYYRQGKEYEVALEQLVSDTETCGKLSIRLGVGEGIFVIL